MTMYRTTSTRKNAETSTIQRRKKGKEEHDLVTEEINKKAMRAA